MKPVIPVRKQSGAVLFIALIMLLILTALSISTMRGVALESRLTGNSAEHAKLEDVADSTLREAEFRFYGPAYLREKLEPNAENCSLDNKIKPKYLNKPCLLSIIATPPSVLRDYTLNPAAMTEENKNSYLNPVSRSGLAWMPYRGRHVTDDGYIETVAEDDVDASWNTYLITGGPADDVPINVEYGAAGEGQGTFYYLINGKANTTSAQSTIANVYVGLNN